MLVMNKMVMLIMTVMTTMIHGGGDDDGGDEVAFTDFAEFRRKAKSDVKPDRLNLSI